jgi:hypothetical protein
VLDTSSGPSCTVDPATGRVWFSPDITLEQAKLVILSLLAQEVVTLSTGQLRAFVTTQL